MRRAIAILLVLGLTVQISAQSVPSSVRIEFVPGLSMTDGTPFNEAQIEHYDIYCDGAALRELANDFTRAFYVSVDDVGAGDHSCTLSETVGGIESVGSDPLSFHLGQRTPNAPTLTTVQGA